MRELTKRLSEILKTQKTHRYKRIIATTMAGVIVFVTTYHLILPALTMDVQTAGEMAGIDAVINEEEFSGSLIGDTEDDLYDEDLSGLIVSEEGDDSLFREDGAVILDDEEDGPEAVTEEFDQEMAFDPEEPLIMPVDPEIEEALTEEMIPNAIEIETEED